MESSAVPKGTSSEFSAEQCTRPALTIAIPTSRVLFKAFLLHMTIHSPAPPVFQYSRTGAAGRTLHHPPAKSIEGTLHPALRYLPSGWSVTRTSGVTNPHFPRSIRTGVE